MSNKNKDLLDLVILTLMEEDIKDKGTKDDQDEMQKAIDWKKRQVMPRIRHELSPVDQSVEDVHRKRQLEE